MKEQIENLEELQEELIDNEEVDEVIDNNKLMAYDIAVFYNTYNLSTLMKWWGNKLIVPDFQRSYVWNQRKASEFVDTMLRGLPVPSMFFYNDIDKSRFLVVDGQQRLHSLYLFIKEKKFGNQEFKLIGNIHPNWQGKSYDELESEDRDRLDDALMNITIMRQLAPDDGQSSMYLAFQRINTGGITLKAQEIRMAVSYGPLAIFIDEHAKDERFNKWPFLRSQKEKPEIIYSPIQEFLLKFWAYYFSYPKITGSSTRTFLDEFFDTQKDFDKPTRPKQGQSYLSKEQFEEAFNAAFEVVNKLTLEDISPYTKPTQTFLEAIWVGLTHRKLRLHKEINVEKLPSYIANWKSTIGDDEFSKLFQARRTSSTKSALERIKAGIEYFSGDF